MPFPRKRPFRNCGKSAVTIFPLDKVQWRLCYNLDHRTWRGWGIFSPMELIQTRQRNCLMMFSTWPIAPASRCSKFLLVFGKVIIIIAVLFVAPVIECSTSPTYGARRNVGRALGRHFSVKQGGEVPHTCNWNQTLSSPSVLCHIKWASWYHQYRIRSLTQEGWEHFNRLSVFINCTISIVHRSVAHWMLTVKLKVVLFIGGSRW